TWQGIGIGEGHETRQTRRLHENSKTPDREDPPGAGARKLLPAPFSSARARVSLGRAVVPDAAASGDHPPRARDSFPRAIPPRARRASPRRDLALGRRARRPSGPRLGRPRGALEPVRAPIDGGRVLRGGFRRAGTLFVGRQALRSGGLRPGPSGGGPRL